MKNVNKQLNAAVRLRRLFCGLIIIFLFTCLSPIEVRSKVDDKGVTLWPAFHALTVQVGKSEQVKIHIRNNTDATLEVEPKFRNLRINPDVPGSIFLSKDDESPPASWLSAVSHFPFYIKPGETREFISLLEIPEGTDSKGYYPVISLRFFTEEKGEVITPESEIASVIYLSVADVLGDEAERRAYIRNFFANKYFLFTSDIELFAEVQNVGDLHFRPRGNIVVYDPKGVRQSNLLTFNDKMIYLLPDQALSESFSWEDETLNKIFPPIGKYRAVFELYLEEDREQKLQSEISFFVFPIQYLIIAILLLVVVCYGVFRFVRWKIRRRERIIMK